MEKNASQYALVPARFGRPRCGGECEPVQFYKPRLIHPSRARRIRQPLRRRSAVLLLAPIEYQFLALEMLIRDPGQCAGLSSCGSMPAL